MNHLYSNWYYCTNAKLMENGSKSTTDMCEAKIVRNVVRDFDPNHLDDEMHTFVRI